MKKENYRGHLAMLGANIMWGFMAPVSKAVLVFGPISYLSLTSFRMIGAAVVFWIASLFMKKEKVTNHDLGLLVIASLFGIVFNQGLFVMGVSLTSPIDASIVTTTTPIIILIIAAFYLKERITWKMIFGIAVGITGALLLILTSHNSSTNHANNNTLGNLLCLAAQFSFSIYFVMFKGLIDRYSPVTVMKWMFTSASIFCFPLSYTPITSIHYQALPLSIYLFIAFIVLGGTFLSYLLISIGQKQLGPTIAGMYNYVQPVVASVVTVLWGMDTFGTAKAVAILFVFCGVYIVNQSKSVAVPE